MEAKKDIGKAIREKLDSLDRQPSDALWNAISTDLDKQKKGKFPFFWLYVVSCTLIGVTVAAFVLSNLEGANNSLTTKSDNQKNTIHETGTVGTSTSGKNNTKDTSIISRPAESSNDTSESAYATKNTTNKNNIEGSVVTTSTKNKTSQSNESQSKKLLNKIQQSKTENEGFATNNTNNKNNKNGNNGNGNNTPKNKKQRSKSGTGTVVNIQKNADTSKSRQSKPYTQKGREYATSPVNNSLPTNSDNDNGSNSTVSQSGNKNTPANPTASAQTTTNDSNNSSSDEENIASSIDTKTIGELNTLAATESSKIVVDSLKTAITDNKEEAKKEDKKDSIPPVPFKKFSVYAYGGPSYFSFPARTIATDSTTANVSTSNTIRYGVLFGYRINNKLSIRTGLSLFNLKQSAKNLKLSYYMETTPIGGAQIVPPPDFTWIDYQQPFGTNSSQIINTLGENYNAIINIDRELSYVEIPLEVSYDLFDKKFGLNVFGGGSMLILNKNKVFAYNEKGKMYLGEWNAAAKTSFTGTLGLGLHYKFTPSLQLNAEPVFNYYFNTYDDSKPYSFTFRLGMQYNFDF